MSILALTPEEREELAYLLRVREDIEKHTAITQYFNNNNEFSTIGYPKQGIFFQAGSQYKYRLFMAANRVGKTLCAAYELTLHLTGNYPTNWTGKRYNFPNNWWVCGVDSSLIQGALQPALLGPVGEFGTGMIPYDCLDVSTLKEAKKADTTVSVFRVKHSSGGYSSVEFKSYESGRKAFQSVAANIWLDEEPPLAIFTECLLRTATVNKFDDFSLIMTFTPLMGISDTIMNFLEGADFREGEVGPGKYMVMASWDDVPHLSESDKKILLHSIPPWQRDSRTRGIPQMGSGAIYPIPFSEISVKRFEIPKHWKRFAGLDVGSKTAAIWFAISPDNGVIYAYHEYYREGELPSVHTQSIAIPGQWIPIAIDSAAHGRSQIDGENLFDLYKELGLDIHNANKAVESGLYTVWELLSTNRLKIFDDLQNFKREYQIYRKDEKGKVVKENDHIMDATRYGIMTGRDLAINESQKKVQYNFGQVSQQYQYNNPIRRY